jgi:ferredoxin
MRAPEIFDQRNEDRAVVLLNENPPADKTDNARNAAAGCPVPVIHIEE